MSVSENNPEQDIRIHVETSPFPIDKTRIRTLIGNILGHFEIQGALVEIAVVDDSAILGLHAQYLGRPKTTDVISFDLSEEGPGSRCFQILVNAQQAVRQAALRGHDPQEELALYIVHGLLHNLGYDDGRPDQARRMHRMEDRLLKQYGWKAVYYQDPSPNTERKQKHG